MLGIERWLGYPYETDGPGEKLTMCVALAAASCQVNSSACGSSNQDLLLNKVAIMSSATSLASSLA
ncbi:hypothetical protein, partial [Pseudomonas protegens]|uniref:hypothetical protein n=1 Tax=Pseudomonas protegens TaxID=380021 RepID=UPI003905FE78